jgi:hypothetical protein
MRSARVSLGTVLSAAVMGFALMIAAPAAHATVMQVAQNAPPADIPPAVIQSLQGADPGTAQGRAQIHAAVTAAVTANPGLAADIAALAAATYPTDAADIAAAAAAADPQDAALILVAVVSALPPGQQDKDGPEIAAAITDAVPGSAEQISAAITQLATSGIGANGGFPRGRGNIGPPLIAPIIIPQQSASPS